MTTLGRDALRDAATSSLHSWHLSPRLPERRSEVPFAKCRRTATAEPSSCKWAERWLTSLANMEHKSRFVDHFSTEETDATGALFVRIHCVVLPEEDDTSWFDSPTWQEGERRVDEHIRAGRVQTFDSLSDFLTDLHARVAE
jgi:hypothetical protein